MLLDCSTNLTSATVDRSGSAPIRIGRPELCLPRVLGSETIASARAGTGQRSGHVRHVDAGTSPRQERGRACVRAVSRGRRLENPSDRCC
jgi:hypothetical protein